MGSPATLDFEALVAPISEDAPAGVYLKDDSEGFKQLQEVKDLRTRAVQCERKLRELSMYTEDDLEMIPEQDRQVDPPDWRSVRQRCVEILKNHSKDLWIAAWLIEALTRTDGFAGARDGFRLVEQLSRTFWDNIHPPPDEDEGYVDTVSQLASLNGDDGPGTLVLPLHEVPLVPGQPDLHHAAYRQAVQGGGSISEAEFQSAIRQTETQTLRQTTEDLHEAIDAFAAMNAVLEERCGTVDGEPVAPPSTNIRKALTEISDALAALTRDVMAPDAARSAANGSPASDVSATSGGALAPSATAVPAAGAQQALNREEAFRMLLKVSEFFRKTEPHSPVSYMLQQAVRFGRMDLPDLLKELIRDDDIRKDFFERTGIPVPAGNDQED